MTVEGFWPIDQAKRTSAEPRRLAARMPFADRREERFRVLNGLGATQRLMSGRLVKLVVE
jgi:predicted Zn-dependent protease